jgi:hypothetical protein
MTIPLRNELEYNSLVSTKRAIFKAFLSFSADNEVNVEDNDSKKVNKGHSTDIEGALCDRKSDSMRTVIKHNLLPLERI